MRKKIIVDTGPLVAFLNRRDNYHSWVCTQLQVINPPMLTCEAVITEASFLLRKYEGAREALFEQINRGLIEIPFRMDEEVNLIQAMVKRYNNVPMSVADACLVAMAERIEKSTVLTLDKDFHIYRLKNRRIIPTITPQNH